MLQRIFSVFCSREYYDIDGKRYFVRELIGQGGFSTVDLVSEASSDRLYALKKIRCHSTEDEQAAEQEIRYHKQINHPSVIECLAFRTVGSADISSNQTSLVLLLLPFYKYGSLQTLLEKRLLKKEPLSDKLILNYFQQICEGLAAIHVIGVAHRDLKPANVLLAPNDRVVIMDLGSAAPATVEITSYNAAQRLQDDAAERCSMTYRAPELFNIQSPSTIDERTDIWSLGCLLYALCYYKSPFDEVFERGDSVALAASSGINHFPNSTTPGVNSSVNDLISTMLVVDPKERPFIADVLSSIEALKGLL
ncbi:serine/threonine-protein kinase 16-like isoform X2 [Daphnia pulicaria]|uniref:serine/threonine-protein kinase 16-like isoform X2 n=1 Tax=Daphnia pulicaria TaxID=35523 RepID=UPI001EEAA9A4|nr:serine/threonine-protein kinase 16-like isoform X2 [Daphnia pulicaria]